METLQSMEQYNEWIQSRKPLVLLFSAGWCPDCTFLDRFIDEVVEDYSDRFTFCKVDRDRFIDLCDTLNVMGIPSFVVYQNGEVIGRFVHSRRKTRPEVEAFLTETWEKVNAPQQS